MLKRNNDLIREWIAALESEKYPQDSGCLHSQTGFCCLGVLCEVGKTRGLISVPTDDPTAYEYQTADMIERFSTVLGLMFMTAVGLTDDAQEKLVSMNDHERRSFKEIAQYIRENILDTEEPNNA